MFFCAINTSAPTWIIQMIFLTKTKSIMMNFEVGKKVICVKAHSQGVVKRGQVFELLGIKKGYCICNNYVLDVGILNKWVFGGCRKCEIIEPCSIHWLSSVLFAPYDDSLSSLTVEMILDEETILQP